jgi:hypothetical protein
MNLKYAIFIVAGLALTAWALPASYRLRSPWRIFAALAALTGVLVSLFGVLALTVPNFF